MFVIWSKFNVVSSVCFLMQDVISSSICLSEQNDTTSFSRMLAVMSFSIFFWHYILISCIHQGLESVMWFCLCPKIIHDIFFFLFALFSITQGFHCSILPCLLHSYVPWLIDYYFSLLLWRLAPIVCFQHI